MYYFKNCSYLPSQCGSDKYLLYFLKSRHIFRFYCFQIAVILIILNTGIGSLAVGFHTNGQITVLDVVVFHFLKIN